MMPRPSRSQRFQDEPMEVSQTSTIDQSVVVDPHTITFIRCILLNRIMTKEDMRALYVQIFSNDRQLQNYKNVLEDVSESLKECKVKIVKGTCEVTDKEYYLVTPTYFKPTQVWPNVMFKEDELNFIKTVINEIIVSDVGLVTLERVVRKHEFIASKDAKRVLEKLVEENYLIEPKDGKYGLSVLSIHELQPYFHYTYRDILKECVFCMRIMFFGGFCQSCKSNGKTSNGHYSCLNKYRESMKNKSAKCPSCNKEWSTNVSGNIEELYDHEDEMEDEE